MSTHNICFLSEIVCCCTPFIWSHVSVYLLTEDSIKYLIKKKEGF